MEHCPYQVSEGSRRLHVAKVRDYDPEWMSFSGWSCSFESRERTGKIPAEADQRCRNSGDYYHALSIVSYRCQETINSTWRLVYEKTSPASRLSPCLLSRARMVTSHKFIYKYSRSRFGRIDASDDPKDRYSNNMVYDSSCLHASCADTENVPAGSKNQVPHSNPSCPWPWDLVLLSKTHVFDAKLM